MKIMNKQKLITILITGIILVNVSGCDNKVNTITSSPITEEKLTITNPNTTTEQQKVLNNKPITKIAEENKSTTNNQNEKKQTNININKEDEVVNYFKKLKDDISKYINEENLDKAKDKIDEAFITTVDFIFYNKEINEVTFSSLSDGTKKQILAIAKDINNIIIKKYPNYQVVIKGKSQKIGNFINEQVDNTKDIIKDKIGDEKYNNIKEGYEETKEKAEAAKDKTLSKIKKWYENKRDSK